MDVQDWLPAQVLRSGTETKRKMSPLQQCAAIPYVETSAGKLVLIVTTRGRGVWTIPKGWPKPKKTKGEVAALEAFEEGGVSGEISAEPIGTYTYTKRLHTFSWVRCRAEVYGLLVERQLLTWPERNSRKIAWVSLARAAEMVRERELSALLRSLAAAEAAKA